MFSKLKTLRFLRTLRSRMTVLIVFCLILPILVLNWIIADRLVRDAESKMLQNIRDNTEFMGSYIGNVFRNVINASLAIASRENTRAIVRDPDAFNDFRRRQYGLEITGIPGYYLYSFDAAAAVVVGSGAPVNLYMGAGSPWYQKMLDASPSRSGVWATDKDFYIYRNIPYYVYMAPVHVGDARGTVAVGVAYDDLVSYLRRYTLYPDALTVLLDGTGRVVFSFDPQNIGMDAQDLWGSGIMELLGSRTSGAWTKEGPGWQGVFSHTELASAPWRLVQAVPRETAYREVTQARTIVLAAMLALWLLASFSAVLLSNSLTRCIRTLQSRMKRYPHMDAYVPLPAGTPEELQDLSQAYQHLLSDVDTLLNTTKVQQQQQEELRFRALQAQINPHFLFNTLNNIKFMALMNGNEEVGRMISYLGNIMEGSIGRAGDKSSLAEEIEHVKSYVYLQKMKYGESIVTTYGLAPGTLGCEVVRFILQPVVENAFQHGVGPLGSGHIAIRSQKDGDDLCLTVSDDGRGIPPEKLARLAAQLSSENQVQPLSEKQSIGLLNVHARLRIDYGAPYGVRITGSPGGGTTVTLTLPARSREEEADA